MTQIICGVDVGSETLDARIGQDGTWQQFARDADGIAELAAFCKTHAVGLVAMEATGGYERLPFSQLWGAGQPRSVEDVALSCPGVHDAAAFAVLGPGGLDQPWLAPVRDGKDNAALAAALRERLMGLPPVHVADVAAIPRNHRGKIERDRLRNAAVPRDRR